MTDAGAPVSLDSLLEHREWLRVLARRLVHDDAGADDLEQQTWLAALRRPPAEGTRLRHWLGSVLRRQAARRYRSDARRTRRERAVAQSEELPDTADLVAKTEAHSLLVRAVLDLDEPFRTTILLRFFEGLTTREIAARMGVPESTVRGRQSRAVAQLRGQLDRNHGGRNRWCALLLPLVGTNTRTTAAVSAGVATMGVILMTLKTKIAIATIALVLLGVGWVAVQDREPPVPDDDVAVADGDVDDPEPERRRLRAGDAPVDVETPPDPVVEETVEDDVESPPELVVRTNVPGAHIRVAFQHYGGAPDPEPIDKTAGEDGSATFARASHPTALAQAEVTCEAEGYARVERSIGEDELQVEIEMRPASLLAGTVRSDDGAALDDAVVRMGRRMSVDTDAAGRFEMFIENQSDVVLHVSHRAHVSQNVPVSVGGGAVDIMLERGDQVSGRVAWPNGDPARGVRVSAAGTRAFATTDADGQYVLSGLVDGEAEIQCQGVDATRTVQAGAAGVDFELEQHGVRVRLVDSERRAFRHGALWIRATHEGGTVFTSAGTAEVVVGRLLFFPEGTTVKVVPSAPGHVEQVTSVVLEGEPAPHDAEIVLEYGSPRGVIALRATDSSGTPLSTVYVDISDEAESPVSDWYEREVTLDSDGRALLENVPPGPMTVEVSTTKSVWSTDGYGMRSAEHVTVVADGERPVQVVIRDGGRLRVTARDVRGEVTAPRRLRLLTESGDHMDGTFLTVRGPGAYTTALREAVPVLFGSPLPEGRYRVVAMPDTPQETALDVIIVAGRTEEVEIVIPDAPE